MPNNKGFEFVGFMAIMVIAVILNHGIAAGLADHDVIKGIATISPWVADHAKQLSWVSEAIVVLTAMVIPVYLMFKDNTGENGLVRIGMVAWAIIITFSVIFLIPSIGYLLGIGWFSAKHLIKF